MAFSLPKYRKKIASKLRESDLKMIHAIPQPKMFHTYLGGGDSDLSDSDEEGGYMRGQPFVRGGVSFKKHEKRHHPLFGEVSWGPDSLASEGFHGVESKGGSSYASRLARRTNNTFKTVGNALKPVGKSALKGLAEGTQVGVKKAAEYAIPAATIALMAAGKPHRRVSHKKSEHHDKKKSGAREARGELIKKVMHKLHCNLPQASKYIKEHGLKY